MILELILALVAGLLIGSFLNVCIFRLPRDLSVVAPRSFCPECEKTIAWYDNIPVVSYLALRGKCRNCGARIGLRYLVVELTTGLAFLLVVKFLGLTLLALKFAIFSASMIALIATDIEERILPDEFTLGGTAVGIVLAYFVPLEYGLGHLLAPAGWGQGARSVAEAVIGAGVGSGSIWFVGWIYEKMRKREGLGFGDVKMIAMIGAFLGLRYALTTLILASLAGSLIGLAFILITRKKASEYELPFGSFLGGAALVLGGVVAWYARTAAG
jgi:leader peptidase (prepilin peptidase)/N-methyltransferase